MKLRTFLILAAILALGYGLGLILMPAFGAGLTWCSHLVRWGDRTTPIGTADIELPPCNQTALERVRELIANKQPPDRSDAGLNAAKLAEEP